ncbi:MAG: hypothetical protein JNK84_05810 [Phreatobacter sp.]|uniref:hypothetical protein n=1 Tax=Phreatobacter sp. TaxID=1966341 RepID=UPI001A48F083|nr:hypothetical protein [Phreatobacter sp.]MBL8568582.1 hypothetical protein [Phreatobacter sp.]
MRPSASLFLSAAFVLVTGSVALAGPADDLSRAAVSGLGGLQIAGAAVGEARDEGSNVVLSNVTFSSAGARAVGVKITRATVTGGVGSTDALSNSRIVLEGVEGTGSDGQSYRIDRAEIAGAQGSFAAILGSLATREPFFQGASEASVTGFSAQSIDIPAMTLQRRRDARMEQAAYRNVRLNSYRQGKIAEMTIAGVTTTPAEGQGSRVEIGASRFVGFDASAGTRAGNTTTVALESGTIDQIRGTSAQNAPFSIDRVSFGKVSMRPGERSLVALTQTMQEIDPAGATEESRRRSMGVVAELFSRLDIDNVEMTGFKGQSNQNQPVVLSRFAIRGVSQGRIASIDFAGLSAADRSGQTTTIGKFTIETIDATGLIALAKDFSEGAYSAGKPVPPSAYPDIRRLLMEDIAIKTSAGQALGSVQRFLVEAGPRIGLVPTRLRAQLEGFTAPINDARQRAQLAPLGLTDKINLGAELDIEYDDASRELRVRNVKVDVDDVGSLNLVMTIGGLDRAQIEALPGSAAVLGLSAKAGRLTLTFSEDGGVASFVSHVAGQTGLSEDDFKEQIKQQAGMMVGQFIQDRALAERITEAFGEFLDDPSSLAITLTPKGDIPLAALAIAMRGSPFAVIPMFNIEVKANE